MTENNQQLFWFMHLYPNIVNIEVPATESEDFMFFFVVGDEHKTFDVFS